MAELLTFDTLLHAEHKVHGVQRIPIVFRKDYDNHGMIVPESILSTLFSLHSVTCLILFYFI